jgi:hypothetical protein
MSEETQFWGVAVEGYDQGHPESVLLEFPGATPDGKPFRYPVFSSQERADKFVRQQGPQLGMELVEQARANIRRIKRNEIPNEQYVSLDRGAPVKWKELLGEH